MKKGLVSVLMGIYNCASTLEEAVDSIIAQTYGDWELIMCDDGSSDETRTVAERICKKEKRARLIFNEHNMGLAKTLNHCLEYAEGEFIARMDGDDVCSPDRFEKELSALSSDKNAALVSSAMYFYDEEGVHGQIVNPEKPNEYDLIKRSPFCHAPCMMRTESLLKVNGYRTDDDTLRIEDYDLWYRIYAHGMYGINIPDLLYGMREDRNAFLRKRKYVYRVNEYKLKRSICKTFNLGIKYKILTVKPLIIGLIPMWIYKILHRRALKA
ncbi:MAG: glycosyltransferase [Clostridia bacterium]|nr:glycosyltransferase [Clostridia bacterium]